MATADYEFAGHSLEHVLTYYPLNTLRPRQDGRPFLETFWNAFFLMKMYKFPKGLINNIPAFR